ncbi:MAG: hypothetical protein AAF204_04115, partial [Pseudomonadota bacterium]
MNTLRTTFAASGLALLAACEPKLPTANIKELSDFNIKTGFNIEAGMYNVEEDNSVTATISPFMFRCKSNHNTVNIDFPEN